MHKMKLSEWWTSGFIFASICVNAANSLICGYNKDTDTADCRNRGLTNVPAELKPSLQHLDLSSNPLKLTDHSFDNLTSLISLKMRYLDLRSTSSSEFALSRLEKLEYLDLTGSKFDKDFNFAWPNSTKTLIIDDTSFSSPDLRRLESLEKLSAKNCSLESFPSCYIYAPLICVDLTGNSLGYLHVSQISYYCLLESLYIKYPASGSTLRSKESYCQCLELFQWSERYTIKEMNLECYKGKESDCKIDFSEDVKRMDECTKRVVYDWKRLVTEVILGALAAVAVFLLMYAIYRKCIAPLLPSEENKPSTTKRPLRPSPKPWRKFSLPLPRFPATPPPDFGVEIEEEEEEEEDDDDD